MPLNSYTCATCGSRNNYVVDTDSEGNQTVECPSCGASREISYRDLPERVRKTIEELHEDARIFEDEQEDETALSMADTVNETLSQVEQRFAEAKNEMSSFDDIIKLNSSISDIAAEYISDEASVKLQSYADSVIDENGQLRQDWKRNGLSAAMDELGTKLDDDTASSRIVSYIQQSLQSGNGIDMLVDSDAMKAAGLGKKERFILKQAAKNNQLSSILKQVLGEENF